jgi:hypothetical protein
MSDSERADVFEISYPKAIKNHVCCECKRIIKIGEKYQLCKGLWVGEWETFKICLSCVELRDKLTAEELYGDGPAFTYLREYCLDSDIPFPAEVKK